MGALRVMVATGAVLAALAFPVEVGAVEGGSVFDSPPAGAFEASSFGLAATEVSATLVQVIDTSEFDPASPDPSGVTYRPGADRLMIVDSEVDETTGAGYHGVNMWELTRTGTVTDTGTTLPYSDEPTGVGHDPGTNTLFISSDDGNRIHVLRPGSDNRFGTPDDVVSFIDLDSFDVEDAEDPEFDVVTGDLFFMDGVNTDVYRIDPVDGTFGNANDVVTHFDVGVHGADDVEALTSDPAAGTLLFGDRSNGTIYEITKSGGLVRTIDASDIAGLDHISGLGRAPASDNSGGMNLWIVDRAQDNDSHPSENDGKLFELSVPPHDGNLPPVINSVVIDQTTPGTDDVLTVTVNAGDINDDPLTYEYQWIKNGADLSGATSPTLDLSVAGNGDKGDAISVRVTASDGVDTSAPSTSAAVTVANAPPAFNQDLGDRTDAEGAAPDFSAGAGDLDDDSLTYAASGLPPGISIDPDSGQISGTIAAGAATGSPYAVEVTVSEDDPPPITLVQSNANSPGSAAQVSVAYPSQPTQGNLLVAFGFMGSNRTPSMPAGWQLALQTNSTPRAVAYYKVAGPNEPSFVTLTVQGSVTNAGLSIFEYAGLRDVQAEVLDRTVSNIVTTGNSASTGTTETTTQANELLMAALNMASSRTFANAWTNGFQVRTSVSRQTVAHRIVSNTGQFETRESWTGSSAGAAAVLVTFTGALPASATDTFTWTVTEPSADLGLVKTDSLDPVPMGEDLTYTLSIANDGASDASAVTVTDTLPAGVEFVSATPDQGSCQHVAGTVSCDLGDLANQASTAVAITVVPTVVDTIVNQASVESALGDDDPDDNSDTEETVVTAGRGYPRPRGASPLLVSLTPAFNRCDAPDRTHGPPMEYPSCFAPQKSSQHLTVGTPDANGLAGQSVGTLRLAVRAGDPSTPANEADVLLLMTITDVRRHTDLADYTGEVQAAVEARITDRDNSVSPGGGTQAATVADTPWPITAQCAVTASTAIGSVCAVTTTYNAIVPGAVKEGKRAIWELDQIQVLDGGSDGVVATNPNTLFAVQGVFVP